MNAEKDRLLAAINERRQILSESERRTRLAADAIDVTLPGERLPLGRQHILTRTIDRVKEVLIGLGYEFVDSPDIQHYHYNFETLNYPPDHPAFDEQMSFYIDDTHLLRTQTTSFQAHVMERQKPPIRSAIVGKCYRYEAVDATHSHTFHQVDLLAVDKGLTLADLKGTFAEFARQLFGPDAEVRFRPDYFPFVEPGVEMAIRWRDRWLELGGAGMVHPNILEQHGNRQRGVHRLRLGLRHRAHADADPRHRRSAPLHRKRSSFSTASLIFLWVKELSGARRA